MKGFYIFFYSRGFEIVGKENVLRMFRAVMNMDRLVDFYRLLELVTKKTNFTMAFL